MNITNNPNYSCVTSKVNPYLDTITFKRVNDSISRQMQTTFLLERMCCFTNSIPYIFTNGRGGPSEFFTQITSEVENNPRKYKCTKQELIRAYNTIVEVFTAINAKYRKDRTAFSDIYNCGVIFLNDIFYKDVCNRDLNKAYFIDGMKTMSANLEKFRTSGPSGYGSGR